jgi:type I restriction enzyme S subunit
LTAQQILPLDEVCNVEYGTRVVHERDGGSTYPVYGGGGAPFRVDEFNREGRFVVARFGMSEECTRFVPGKFFLNDSGLTVSPKSTALLPRFVDYQLMSLRRLAQVSRSTASRSGRSRITIC